MFFYLLTFHNLGQPWKTLRKIEEEKGGMYGCWGCARCVSLRVSLCDCCALPHFHADWVKRCADGAGGWKEKGRREKKKQSEAVLLRKTWQMVEVRLQRLLAAIQKKKDPHQTRSATTALLSMLARVQGSWAPVATPPLPT